MRTGTIYSASDKSLFDALNQKNVTNADLRELFLSRGILVSKDTSRKDLAKYFSRLSHDYFDYDKLAKLFGSNARREKMSAIRSNALIELEFFESSALDLKADLEADGASVRVTKFDNSPRIDIEIKYQTTLFNKSEFRQIVDRIALIQIEKQGDEIVIYSPSSDDPKEWVLTLSNGAAEKAGIESNFEEIRLSPSLPVEKKNAFFARLIKQIEGFTFFDVSDVYVSRPKTEVAEEDIEESDDDDVETGIHISKASLRGEGVMQSEELKSFAEKGFYVSKVVWTAKQPTLDSDIYEFEAQFSNPDSCCDFSYLPRGFYKYQRARTYNQTRTGFSKDEDSRLGRLIEAAARKTLVGLNGD